MRFWFLSITFLLLCAYTLKAQISHGGTPSSFLHSKKLKSTLSAQSINPPNIAALVAQDIKNDSLRMPYRIAEMIPVEFCMHNTGKWDTLSNGDIVWRLKITSVGALGLQLIYNKFHLPKGSKLFLYSADKKYVIGSFTEQNNHPSGLFATEIIPGESCTLEYIANPENDDKPSICITKVGYVYRGMNSYVPASRMKSASTCEVNVACSPEGDNWKDVKRSVAKVLISGHQCTGTLLNNTAMDFKNYFATAFHCINGYESDAPTWVFYFNFERSDCSETSTLISAQTITGADIRAAIPLNGGSDAALLEIQGTIPASYNAFWAGWDITDTLIAGGVCIHHPQNDVKKISTARTEWKTDRWRDNDNNVGANNADWNVQFSATTNGSGITEDGSSGAGIFSPDERFRGQLTGGASTCAQPSGANYFGKLTYSWDQQGTTSDVQFKPWLDPLNTGQTKINGVDANAGNGIFWTSSPTAIESDSVIKFKDETQYNPTAWNWTFEGGTPATSTLQNPTIKYTNEGLFDVTLEVTNDNGTFTKTRTDYVYVKPRTFWLEQNSRFPAPSRAIAGFSIVDPLTVWAWAYDGINPGHYIKEYTRTINGGKTWYADSIVIPSLAGYGISNLSAVSKDVAFASLFGPNGGGSIVQTIDGGKTWQIQPTAFFLAPSGFPDFVHFFDSYNGVCVGDPNSGSFEIYTTNTGGLYWTRTLSYYIPTYQTNETGDVNKYDASGDTVWFGTSAGRVFRSVNKGQNWTVSDTKISGMVDVRFRNATTGFAFKQIDSNSDYAIKKSTDGGLSWSDFVIPSNFIKGKLANVPGTTATWVNVGSGTQTGSAYTTNDGGSYSLIDNTVQYTAVKFFNDRVGWAGSFNIDSVHGGIYCWNKRDLPPSAVKNLSTNGTLPGIYTIYPNPAKDAIYISAEKIISHELRITIYNMQGSAILEHIYQNISGNFNEAINLGSLRTGIYIVSIQNETNTERQKIVIL
jgi:PKD repeat protein